MERVDARTGKSQWTHKVAMGVNGVYLFSLDENGKARASIRPNRDHQVVNGETFNAVVETCGTIVVGEEQLHITTDDDIVAYDLGTGKTVFKFDPIPGGGCTRGG